jgi:WD40 repeat protein
MWGFYITLWQVSDGSLIRTLELEDDSPPSSFSPPVKVGSPNHTVNLKSAPSWVCYYAFSPDGQMLALGSQDAIVLWRSSDGGVISTIGFSGVTNAVPLIFSPDGQMLASRSGSGTIKLWRISDGSLVRALEERSGESSNAISFSPDGRLLVSALSDGTIRLWGVLP